jgi:tetratricopeptide (TPR) repeat protein
LSIGNLGNFKEGEIYLEKGQRTASEIDDLRALGFVELFYGGFFTTKGNWKLAIEHLQGAIKYSEEMKWLLGSAMARSHLGHAYSQLGDPQTGKRYAEKGLRIQHDSGIEFGLSTHQYSFKCDPLSSERSQKCSQLCGRGLKAI